MWEPGSNFYQSGISLYTFQGWSSCTRCVFSRFLLATNEMAAEWLFRIILQKNINGNSSNGYWEAILKYVTNTSFRAVPYWHVYHDDFLAIILMKGIQAYILPSQRDATSTGFPTDQQPGLHCWSTWGAALDVLCDFGEDFVVSPLLLLSYFYCPVCCLQERSCFGYDCGSLRLLSYLFSQIYTVVLELR